ncbi:hypothetical protein J6590_015498 [Homalodisca vitripennis]|nr:hypothetical protein J6590_015498 [Homalodisca vitripennis]
MIKRRSGRKGMTSDKNRVDADLCNEMGPRKSAVTTTRHGALRATQTVVTVLYCANLKLT